MASWIAGPSACVIAMSVTDRGAGWLIVKTLPLISLIVAVYAMGAHGSEYGMQPAPAKLMPWPTSKSATLVTVNRVELALMLPVVERGLSGARLTTRPIVVRLRIPPGTPAWLQSV